MCVSMVMWGTCPGLTLVCAHLNLLIQEHNLNIIFRVGPGHGAPSVLASFWLESLLGWFCPQHTRDQKGLHNPISTFSISLVFQGLCRSPLKFTFATISLSLQHRQGLTLPCPST